MAWVGMICGALFGLGLAVSGMVNPAKVLAFLDVAGDWDPSLALVMAGALIPSALAFKWIPARFPKPLMDHQFHLPGAGQIDQPLIGGAVMFGVGWGLVGLCPGPAIAGLAYGHTESFIFFAAMAAGIALSRLLDAKSERTPVTETG